MATAISTDLRSSPRDDLYAELALTGIDKSMEKAIRRTKSERVEREQRMTEWRAMEAEKD